MGPLWSAGRLLAQPVYGGAGPHQPALRRLAPQVPEAASLPPHLVNLAHAPGTPAAPGGPLHSVHIAMRRALTLQEVRACGPGWVGVGVGAAETGCVPVILRQGRQEGQMGFLVSALAPSCKKGLGIRRAMTGRVPCPRATLLPLIS